LSKQEPKNLLGVLSIGVFIVVVSLCLFAFSMELIAGIDGVLALIVGFYGMWIMILAAIKAKKTDKYGRSPLSIFAWGLLTSIAGYGWYISILGVPKLYVFSMALLILGVLIVAVALQRSRKA